MTQQPQTTHSQSKRIELILHQLDSLPTLPAVAARLLQLTARTDTQAEDVVRLIESDPSLASRLIALATHAGRGVRRETATVKKVVVLLGFEAVRNAVLSIKVFETLVGRPGSSQAGIFDREGFWKHSLAVACAARMLIKHIDHEVDSEEAFICGLLHDMGKVALDAVLPKSFARVVQLTESSMGNISDLEQRILGIDHNVAGKRLAEKWSLPEAIKEVVWLHHQQVGSLPEAVKHRSIVQTVHLADVLARQQRIGYSGNHSFAESASEVAEQLGCPESALEQTARQLGEEIAVRARILGLGTINSEQLYHEALSEANRELGRLNQRLRQQNQNLRRRSVYFDLLSELSAGLRTHQSVVEVCALIARLWQRHKDCGHCAVYAVGAADELIFEGAVKLKTEEEAKMFLVDRTEDPDVTGEDGEKKVFWGVESVQPIGTTHDWFIEQVAPMFEASSTMMLPLRRGEEIVGALLWERNGVEPENYRLEQRELKVFSASAAWALHQAYKHAEQSHLSEQLARTNRQLHDAQRELVQKRSMAAVGEMACGAAHEINNPLAVVVGRSQLLASSESDARRKEALEAIAEGGEKITRIISELMEFARPASAERSAWAVAELINKAVQLRTEAARPEKVRFESELEENLPPAYVDGEQVAAALGELLANAIDSYQGHGGVVRIHGRRAELEDEIILEVSDEGCGMDEVTRQKAFDPFFSFRRAGRGRGLGLSRCNRYLAQNGASVQLLSELNKGTVARVRLPIGQGSEGTN